MNLVKTKRNKVAGLDNFIGKFHVCHHMSRIEAALCAKKLNNAIKEKLDKKNDKTR